MEPRFNQPKQRRSAAAVERILAACEELLRTHSFEELTVLDICIEADVSSSTMYARFAGKDAILLEVLARYRQRVRSSTVAAVLEAAEQDDLTVGDAARAFVGVMVSFFREHSHLAEALLSNELTQRANHDLYDGVVGVVMEVVPLLVGPIRTGRLDELRTKTEFVVRATGAIIMQGTGVGLHFADRMGLDDESLTTELSALAIGYLAEHLGTSAAELVGRPVAEDVRSLLVEAARQELRPLSGHNDRFG